MPDNEWQTRALCRRVLAEEGAPVPWDAETGNPLEIDRALLGCVAGCSVLRECARYAAEAGPFPGTVIAAWHFPAAADPMGRRPYPGLDVALATYRLRRVRRARRARRKAEQAA